MPKSPESNSPPQASSQTPDARSTNARDSVTTNPDVPTLPYPSSQVDNSATIKPDASTLPYGSSQDSTLDKAGNVVAGGRQGRDGLIIGERLEGKYEIIRLIGEGGMGQVYLARHVDLGTMVAIKVLNNARIHDEQSLERFKREARTSAKIVHPNAVRVFDYGVQNNTCYLVMEYLEGESLSKRLATRKRLPLSEVINFAEQVCYVLEVMHRKGIIHRDLKPDNIFFHRQDDTEIVKVLDFGLVKFSHPELGDIPTTFSGKLTNPGIVVGTPHYMSPEQCMDMDLDGRSDLYSLGIIIYEMLAGRAPFNTEKSVLILSKHISEPAPPLCEVAPDVPLAVSDVVMRLLSKDPADRFQYARDFLEALCESTSVRNSLYLKMLEKSHREIRAKDKPVPPILKFALAVIILGAVATAISILWKARDADHKVKAHEQPTSETSVSSLGDNFVLIPGGTCTIGRDPGDCQPSIPGCKISPDETPPHTVTLATYYLSKYEMTNKEYREFIVATGHQSPQGWREQNYPIGTDDFPVTYVSWDDAMAYCRWRAERDHIQFRLPTEDEWEYAARGNDTRLYPWGDAWNNNFANANNTSNSSLPIHIAPNNTADKSTTGIFAMAGNVAEWTASNFDIYPESNYKPKKLDLECKIIRGGGFNSLPNGARTTFRAWEPPSYREKDLGFRLAATPPPNIPN